MQTAELADLEHQNMVEVMATFCAQVPGARVERSGGVALCATSLPLRLFNQVLVEDQSADAAGIAVAVAVARDRGDRFVVNLRVGSDDRYLLAMNKLGLVPLSENPWMPGMAFHPLPRRSTYTPAPGHEIRSVSGSAGMDEHIRTAALGFGMPEDWLRAVMPPSTSDHPAIAVYVGYADGEPVTTGLGFRTGRTIGVYNISTVESARRRGFGADMTLRVVEDGLAAGCDVAILQASDMGRPIYERLGFRTVVEYAGWIDPEPSAEG